MPYSFFGRFAGPIALFTLFLSSQASAVMQANNTVIPQLPGGAGCQGGNIQSCLDLSEGTPGLIGAVADALISPETFQPTCVLTFTPFIKGGGNSLAFGWYNVKPDPENEGQFLEPDQTERFGMVRFDGVTLLWGNAAFTPVSLDLNAEREAGRYLGGEIGFFLVGNNAGTLDPETHLLSGGTDLFYTQHALNPGAAGPWYQVLTWQSVAFENAFDFGWEDLVASSSSDNDFDDLAFLVTGIQCAGGGAPCDTGEQGVCALGTQQCTKGELGCVQNVVAGDESCNALDDDCNGEVDDGDLCGDGEVCDRGLCVPKCGGGEFRNCPSAGYTCSRGLCMEEECVDVECPAGEVCHGGDCVDACEGVVCPYGRLCRNGGCVDPCLGIVCDDGYSCSLGICTSCECSACGAGETCHENLCVDEGCDTMTCDTGAHCAEGVCVGDCDGATCPSGQICMGSECIVDPNAVVDGAGGEMSIDIPEDPDASSGAAGGTKSGPKGSGAEFGVERPSGSDATCLCAVPGTHRDSNLGWLAALLGTVVVVARRRRAA